MINRQVTVSTDNQNFRNVSFFFFFFLSGFFVVLGKSEEHCEDVFLLSHKLVIFLLFLNLRSEF